MPRSHISLLQYCPIGKEYLLSAHRVSWDKSGMYSVIAPSLHRHQPTSPPSTLQPTISPTRTTTLAPSRKSHQTYPPRDLRTGRWWCRESRGVRGGRLLHDASTANHSARADGLTFQFAVSPPRACNDTLNTLRDGVPLSPLLVLSP